MTRTLAAIACITILQIATASAQAPSTNCTPTRSTPDPNGIATTGRTSEPLGDKLAKSDGVLCPPAGVDPEMRAPAPDAGTAKMPVIPPPGSPGGDPSVRPK